MGIDPVSLGYAVAVKIIDAANGFAKTYEDKYR